MVDIKKIKLILGIFIPFFAFFLMSQNTFAADLNTGSFEIYASDTLSSNYYWTSGLAYGTVLNRQRAQMYNIQWAPVSVTGNSAAIHFETNIVGQSFNRNNFNFINGAYFSVLACATTSGTRLSMITNAVTFAETDWTGPNGQQRTTLTLYGDVAVGNIPSGTQTIYCSIGTTNSAPFFIATNTANVPQIYFERNPSNIIFTNSQSDAYSQAMISQNNTMIQQNNQSLQNQETIINNIPILNNSINGVTGALNEQQQQEQEGIDNISNQSSNDIDGATNSQTTSLIDIIVSFINAFSRINSTNCNLTLSFPEYAGGSRIVDICSGKDKAPRIVEIGSSLLLICVFVPLAYVLIRMIYKEIRSWTNG